MSGLNPTGPSQPTVGQSYTTTGNSSTKNPLEQSQASFNAADNTASVDQRIPTKQATDAQGLANAKFEEGRGVHGAPAGEEAKGLTEEDVGRHRELDGEQMAAPGEGKVAAAVRRGGEGMGGGGEQPDLAADLDRKKAEQAEAREAIKQSQGGTTGTPAGGPANPVDNASRGNYPNSGTQD